MRLIIFEDKNVLDLEPITISRPMFDIRFGRETLLSLFEKINYQNRISLWVRSELKHLTRERFPDYQVNQLSNEDVLWLNSRVLWEKNQIEKVFSSYFHSDPELEFSRTVPEPTRTLPGAKKHVKHTKTETLIKHVKTYNTSSNS